MFLIFQEKNLEFTNIITKIIKNNSSYSELKTHSLNFLGFDYTFKIQFLSFTNTPGVLIILFCQYNTIYGENIFK